jgi:hypothetical protein
LKHAFDLFPGLDDYLDETEPRIKMSTVADFRARVWVICGGRFRIRRSPRQEAEAALIVWYEAAITTDEPLLAEFSFRYKDARERFRRKPCRRAHRAFERLQAMSGWVDSSALTKTAYVYRRAATS